ncbi:MAG: PQQ-dependent sugar dehydrogenase [Alphaproteobacteria bacterium]|nr:PQQ-dependent sugar dehydrogenase [Alphaproteobacteria bacterium]
MRNAAALVTLAAALGLAGPVLAQQAPTATPEQIAAAAIEDQLGDAKCGVPRNAADDYRPKALFPDQTRAPRVSGKQSFKVETVAAGLPSAWGLAFLPSGNMLVTIRAGGLRTVTPDGKVSEPLAGTPAIKTPIRLFGMHDVILDKDFATNRTLYFAYVTESATGVPNTGYVASAKLAADEKSITDLKVLKEGAMTPRRVAQMKDGTLLVVTADVVTPYPSAQSMKSAQGKVLRINTDGSIPKDNPYLSTPDADPSIYAVGFRDAQGMTFHPVTGEPWLIENHPRGGDELNIVKPGVNYGFPLVSYGRDNDGKLLNGGKTQQDGLEQPVYFWTPSVAFSGMTIYSGDKLPGWKDSVFLGGLSGMQLVRLEMKGGRVVGEEKLLRDRCKRLRDVRQGPDGLLYVLTDGADGEILRISPS